MFERPTEEQWDSPLLAANSERRQPFSLVPQVVLERTALAVRKFLLQMEWLVVLVLLLMLLASIELKLFHRLARE